MKGYAVLFSVFDYSGNLEKFEGETERLKSKSDASVDLIG